MNKLIEEWAARQEWSKGYAHVAKVNGMSFSLVYARAKKLRIDVPKTKRGMKVGTPAPWMRKLPVDVEFDFTKSNAELARQYNVSGERIRQLRKAAGAPKISRKRTKA